jgi:hypothetical protein
MSADSAYDVCCCCCRAQQRSVRAVPGYTALHSVPAACDSDVGRTCHGALCVCYAAMVAAPVLELSERRWSCHHGTMIVLLGEQASSGSLQQLLSCRRALLAGWLLGNSTYTCPGHVCKLAPSPAAAQVMATRQHHVAAASAAGSGWNYYLLMSTLGLACVALALPIAWVDSMCRPMTTIVAPRLFGNW